MSETEAPSFVFIDRKHQGHDGKGWRQSKDEGAYEPDLPPDAAGRSVEWTGEYVIQRLIEAFKTDRRQHFQKPKETGGSHPQITYSDEDKAGWLEQPKEDNQIRAKDTREQLDQMEEAFGWLGLGGPEPYLELSLFTKRKVYKAKWAVVCRKHGWHVDTANDRARAQARRIADRLVLAKVLLP